MKAALQCIEWREKGRSCFHELRSEEHTSELQSRRDIVCRLLLEKKKFRCIIRMTFWNASSKVLPIPITSPTDFMAVPIVSSTPLNFSRFQRVIFFFFNDTATTEIYTLSLHDALPI